MKTASQILAENRIIVRSLRGGNMKTKCPKCSHLRKHKADPCLSVRVMLDGVVWNCHNCSFHGGEYFEARADRPAWHGAKRREPARGGGYAGMQHAAAAAWR